MASLHLNMQMVVVARRPASGLSGILCVRPVRHWLKNRSPKTTANWVLASNHSRGGRFQSS
ncbi:hypothetical protein, partial [Rhizobium sp. GCM10022189]|uniref:hypothetical protein n=1 Tax=Rhizobium sp. GCM10022189 TaxID=3252654 RepID=UPI00360B888B